MYLLNIGFHSDCSEHALREIVNLFVFISKPAVELVSHAIQTTPPPPSPPPTDSLTSQTEETEEDTATSSWGTMTETGGDHISEGQILVSTRSEGEVAAAGPGESRSVRH